MSAMLRIRIFITLLSLFLSKEILAQRIDNSGSFRPVNSERYFRFSYDNDFFTDLDEYYSQGINLELVNPALLKNPLNLLLIHFKDSVQQQYGLAIEHDAFTPNSIRHEEIIKTERPYTAAIMLKSFRISVNDKRTLRIASGINIGLFGTDAKGMEMQKGIHKALNNIEPLGWENQLHDDLILNYSLTTDINLITKKYLCINNTSLINAGTYNDNISTGFTFMFGLISNPFFNSPDNKLHFYIYNQPIINVIGFDATLQGGIFNRSSPHTLSAKEVNRFTFQDNYGIVLKYKIIYLEYSQNFLTKEYKSGAYHRWGGVKGGIVF